MAEVTAFNVVFRMTAKLGSRRGSRYRRCRVRARLNRILRGWSNYFGYGTRLMAYRAVDHYVYERVRNFLRHRHKVASRASPAETSSARIPPTTDAPEE